MYKIACIMGKSSSGKDHIYKALLDKEELKLNKIVMYTTRPKRSGEKNGVEYYFTSDETADNFMKKNKIIELREYETVYGVWKYFTADDGQIDLNTGRYLVIGTLEVYEKFCQYYGNDVVMPIYIDVDDRIRLERALKRENKQAEPKYKEMCRRFIADCDDFSEEKLKEAGISRRYYNNAAIDDCIDEIAKDIRKEML